MIKTEEEMLAMLTPKKEYRWGDAWADGDYLSYESIVERAVPTATWLISEYEGDYQGDCYMVGKDDEKWYFFTHSYGSCSGCDALESEGREAISGVLKAISEFDSKEELLEWARKFDWTYEWRSKEEDSFESKLIKRIEAL